MTIQYETNSSLKKITIHNERKEWKRNAKKQYRMNKSLLTSIFLTSYFIIIDSACCLNPQEKEFFYLKIK
ncbi:hypothetical protein BpHYR1_031553 [Brachionus plicatilis]|uniref:Uncharacterized protein n=1 Tax=Brachionus plicatilis TaxID=10195 RepID=A0A3M7Q9S7_BRAPC|nr:hypothetical protein BpHYR1_031553 [Brachionus plicatilis]